MTLFRFKLLSDKTKRRKHEKGKREKAVEEKIYQDGLNQT
jgi:hypothetical protein